MAKESGASIAELELANVRTRHALERTLARARQKADVPERWRLLVARGRQQLRRDPTPLVAMMIIAGTGVVAIVGGSFIGRTRAGHLEAASTPMLVPVFKPAKTGKDGRYKGAGAFARKPDKLNPTEGSKQYKKAQKKRRKQQSK